MSDEFFEQIQSNVREVRQRIEEAARRSARTASEVRLIAVSKYVPAGDPMIEALIKAGCLDLGEARPQTLVEKADYYSTVPIRWHLIGSLQRNKIRKILPCATLIHSVDSVRLAEAIDRIAVEESLEPVRCLLEIAISGDETKQGFEPKELSVAVDEIGRMPNLHVDGLMCMSGLESEDDERRRQFEAVRCLAETLRQRGLPPNVSMTELSMGMSDDFEIAVEEGATLVRVGSRLYR